MAKGPIVTPEVEARIAAVYLKHRKWKAKEVQRIVSHLLSEENPKLPKGWPSLSTVQKVLAKVRKPQPPDPQDEPWSMATLDQYPLPPEAIPAILKVWKLCYEAEWFPDLHEFLGTAAKISQGRGGIEKIKEAVVLPTSKDQLSIRDAKWIARLSYTTSDTNRLTYLAFLYSGFERLFRDIGKPFDSTGWDGQLLIENRETPTITFRQGGKQ